MVLGAEVSNWVNPHYVDPRSYDVLVQPPIFVGNVAFPFRPRCYDNLFIVGFPKPIVFFTALLLE